MFFSEAPPFIITGFSRGKIIRQQRDVDRPRSESHFGEVATTRPGRLVDEPVGCLGWKGARVVSGLRVRNFKLRSPRG